MPKRSIDELLEAIETVDYLKFIVDEHDATIKVILGRLDRLEERGPDSNPVP